MSKVLNCYFRKVVSSDIHGYGFGSVKNFLDKSYKNSFDWVITNPPFRLAEEFFNAANNVATNGVALLARTVLEGKVGIIEYLKIIRLLILHNSQSGFLC